MQSFAAAFLVADTLIKQATTTIYGPLTWSASSIRTAVTPCNVHWNDDVNALALATIDACNIELCTGGVQQQTCLETIAKADVSSNAYVTYLPDASVSPNGAFSFVKFTSLNYKEPANPHLRVHLVLRQVHSQRHDWYFNSAVQAQISGVVSSTAAATTTGGASLATSASKASTSASSTANGAIDVTAPGVVSSTIGLARYPPAM